MLTVNNEERLMDKKIMDKLIDKSGDWKDKPPDLPDLINWTGSWAGNQTHSKFEK